MTGFLLTPETMSAIVERLRVQTIDLSRGELQAEIACFKEIEYDSKEIRFVLDPYATNIRLLDLRAAQPA